MERLAERHVLVDPERLCAAGVSPPRGVPASLPLYPGDGREGQTCLRLSPLRGAREPTGAEDLSRTRHGQDALSGVRGAEARSPLLPVEHVPPDAGDAFPFARPVW